MNHIVCPLCGGEMIWDSNANASDVCDFYEDDDEAVVSYYTCSKCGRNYEIIDPLREERDNEYKEYWHGKG